MHFTAVWEATVKMATDREVCFQSSKQHHVSGWSTARQTACGRWVRKPDSYRVTQFVDKSVALMHCVIVTAGPQVLDVGDCSTLGLLQTRYIEPWCVTNEIYRTILFRSVANIWQYRWQAICSTISCNSSCLLLAVQILQEMMAFHFKEKTTYFPVCLYFCTLTLCTRVLRDKTPVTQLVKKQKNSLSFMQLQKLPAYHHSRNVISNTGGEERGAKSTTDIRMRLFCVIFSVSILPK